LKETMENNKKELARSKKEINFVTCSVTDHYE